MPQDINLLPEDLREKERRELEKAKKKPRILEVKMAAPQKQKVLETKRPNFLTSLINIFLPKRVEKKEPKVIPQKISEILALESTPPLKEGGEKVGGFPPTKREERKKAVLPSLAPSRGILDFLKSWIFIGGPKKEEARRSPQAPTKIVPKEFAPTSSFAAGEALGEGGLKGRPTLEVPLKQAQSTSGQAQEILKRAEGITSQGRRKVEPSPSAASLLSRTILDREPIPKKTFWSSLVKFFKRSTAFRKEPKKVEIEAEKSVLEKADKKAVAEPKRKIEIEPKEEKKKRLEIKEVNLMPQGFKSERERGQNIFLWLKAGLIILVTIIIIGITYLGITWYQLQRITQIKKIEEQIALKNKEIIGLKNQAKEILTLKDKIQLIQSLLEKHISWSNVFSLIEKYTIPQVYYPSVSLDTSGKIMLPVIAKDYSSLIRQVMIFKQARELIQAVEFTTIAKESTKEEGKEKSRIRTSLNITLVKDIFTK